MRHSVKHSDDTQRWLRALMIVGLGVAAMITPTGCGGTQRRGPMEEAGHDIDDAAEDVEEEVDEAVD